jgi:hypothetical protein
MNDPTFEGFVPPIKNYFPMPNQWIDICAKIKSLAEMKVVQYVIRHTWGFQEYDGMPKAITTDEFMHGRKRQDKSRIDHGTGLSNRSVIDGLREAVEHGYLIQTIDDTDKARISKAYALRMVQSDMKKVHIEIGCEESSQQLCKSFTSDMNQLHSNREESSHRSEKDTLETHLEKDTLETQESDALTGMSNTYQKQYHREEIKKLKRDTDSHLQAMSSCSQAGLQENDEDISLAETAHRMPAVKVSSQHTTSEPVSSQDGAASAAASPLTPPSSGPRASGQDYVQEWLDKSEPGRPKGKPFVVQAQPQPPVQSRMQEPKPPTDKQINDRRAKEIWARFELRLETKFSASQRKLPKHARGMEHLIEDQITDEQIDLGLSQLDQWQIHNFTVERFYELLPGLTARHRPGQNGKKPDDPTIGVSGLPKYSKQEDLDYV